MFPRSSVFTSFGAFTAIEPGARGVLEFEYLLPESVSEQIRSGTYDLTVYKQIGARNHALTLDLKFDKTLVFANPGEDPREHGDATYFLNTSLDQDQVFDVRLESQGSL